MPFLANIPQPGDLLSKSQQDLLNNNSTLNSSFGVDHTAFDVNTNVGFHKQVHLISQAPPGASAGIGQIFNQSLNDNIATDTELFFLTGGNRLLQLTRNFVPTVATNGATFLPGGLILNWGRATKSTGQTVSFTQAYTNAASVYSIQTTLFQNTSNRHFIYVQSTTNTNFTVASRDSSGSDETNTFSWIAIGS